MPSDAQLPPATAPRERGRVNNYYQSFTLQGTIVQRAPEIAEFTIQLRNGDQVLISAGDSTSFDVLKNLDGVSRDRVAESSIPTFSATSNRVLKYCRVQDTVIVRGFVTEVEGRRRYEARRVILMHSEPGRFVFEDTHWWLTQIRKLADQWLDSLFGDRRDYQLADFLELYRTNLNIIGLATDDNVQEMATLSRLIYGLSSSFLMTGTERYLAAAAAGVKFQRETFRTLSHDGEYCIWASSRRRGLYGTKVIMPSSMGDDAGCVTAYEQIYALAGLAQYYRATGDSETLQDIRRTVASFDRFFLDEEGAAAGGPLAGGYFSHIDPASMRPDAPSLGINRLKKNWNSVGDHIPAYLVNVLLALDPLPAGLESELEDFVTRCRAMLDRCTDLILSKFPDPDGDCPYVRERFHADWSYDDTYSWQQDRAIIGHNLKIAWNFGRAANYYLTQAVSVPPGTDRNERAAAHRDKAHRLLEMAKQLGRSMRSHGLDLARGGCYDAVERRPKNGMPMQFPWEPTKDFWQQEQCILAYLILHTHEPEAEFLDLARDAMAFWNAFFVDQDNQGIFFRTYEDGTPCIQGNYANKATSSIAGYHAFELNYLAHYYIRLYATNTEGELSNFSLFFRPCVNSGLRSLNVLPDFVKPDEVEVHSVKINGVSQRSVDHDNFQITLPEGALGSEIVVEFKPVQRGKSKVELSPSVKAPVGRKGKIAVLIEDHFDDTEFLEFNKFFPSNGYDVEYISRLWGASKLSFNGNESRSAVTVTKDVSAVKLADYSGILAIGAYAMDRLRYEEKPLLGQPNRSPAVEFLRSAMHAGVKVGTVCHSLWLLTAAPELLRDRKVTCAHNLISDVQNAGALVQFGQDGTVPVFVDGNLITGKHPGHVAEFMAAFLNELDSPMMAAATK
jgi:putative intracellular protease/amidase/mannose/cellobiose epimerase-like protein (N-acyl-D-glucosamine 2-epimerase family)